jgi:enoyl-CoA hydratase
LTDLHALDAVTIAAIDGLALGGGFELALTCDLRFLGPSAAVGLPEIKLGLLPGATGTQRLTHLVGPARAEEMMLTGRTVRVEEAVAYAIGIPAATTAAAEAVEWASRNLGGDNVAAAAIRRCVEAAHTPGVDGMAVEFDEVAALFASELAQQRIAAFIKRHS